MILAIEVLLLMDEDEDEDEVVVVPWLPSEDSLFLDINEKGNLKSIFYANISNVRRGNNK